MVNYYIITIIYPFISKPYRCNFVIFIHHGLVLNILKSVYINLKRFSPDEKVKEVTRSILHPNQRNLLITNTLQRCYKSHMSHAMCFLCNIVYNNINSLL